MIEKRVIFFYPNRLINTVPSIHNAIILLTEYGFKVDVITNTGQNSDFKCKNSSNIFIDPHFSSIDKLIINSSAKLISFSGHLFKSNNSNRFSRLKSKIFVGITSILDIFQIKYCQIKLNTYLSNHTFDYYFIVDPKGAIFVENLYFLLKGLIVYWSLEITTHKILEYEKKAIQKSDIIIIQDTKRGVLFSSIYGNIEDKLIYIPNSYLGASKREKKYYWHKKFHLDPERKIVINAGSLCPWAKIPDIISSVEKWPDNWVLIIHSRHDLSFHPELPNYIDKMKLLAPKGKVYFSLDPEIDEIYDIMISSADIGIAFYEVDRNQSGYLNIKTIGHSSGKISQYLHHGLPVIVNNFIEISDIFNSNCCGISVKNTNEISCAIKKIENNYDFFSKNSIRYYNKFLRFEDSFNILLNELKARKKYS